jgi:putative glutamine amidotransferase
VQYGDSHTVQALPVAGLLELTTWRSEINSLHGQALDQLGRERIEGLSVTEDGLVEAIHLPGVEQFTLAVTMALEWQHKSAFSENLQAFSEACHEHAAPSIVKCLTRSPVCRAGYHQQFRCRCRWTCATPQPDERG